MIKIYNSLTKKKQEFIPVEKNHVKFYACGVTVYDDCHIGHGRSLYIFDVIYRYLEFRGYKVKFVRNITDIDDKIINKSRQLGISWKEVADKYIGHYRKDLENLELKPINCQPKATENIKEMINYIKQLIEKEYAYQTDTGVYFSVRKFSQYGKLSGQKIDDILASGRISADENKKDPLDFALWKASKQGEPSWESPWGKGRPGWHIECSVMSQKYLDCETLDIHGGGRDLIFPHHENEAAQAESLSGKNFANYWLHHGLLTIEGEKMSKSLGNFVKISDVLNRYPADVLKLFYLQAHYSSAIDFSWAKMEEAKKAYQHIKILKEKLENYLQGKKDQKEISEENDKIKDYRKQFSEVMDDDFNMPKGLAVLFDLINQANKKFAEKASNKKDKSLAGYRQILAKMTNIFGFSFSKKEAAEINSGQINKLIEKRNQCRTEKNFKKADQIRDELAGKGIILEDSKEGTGWRRK